MVVVILIRKNTGEDNVATATGMHIIIMAIMNVVTTRVIWR